jgi:aspartyl-tRNA(Asn)/glutamyl-tRNA(Gln) amidotransferase subunit C
MPVSVDSANVRAIAELARLAIPSDREASLAAELSAVLDLFDALAAAPVDGLTPLAHPGDPTLRLRPDSVSETDQREAFAAVAPAESAGYYLVPKVIE